MKILDKEDFINDQTIFKVRFTHKMTPLENLVKFGVKVQVVFHIKLYHLGPRWWGTSKKEEEGHQQTRTSTALIVFVVRQDTINGLWKWGGFANYRAH